MRRKDDFVALLLVALLVGLGWLALHWGTSPQRKAVPGGAYVTR